MKKIVFMFAIAAAFFMTNAGRPEAQEHKGPKLEVAQDNYELGKVVQGAEAAHTFEIRNTGDEPLVVERVQTS